MNAIRKACAAGYERLAARADLLDRINVFPVADQDTGVNLRLTLVPLRETTSAPEHCQQQVNQSAHGNSGNIAAAFLAPLLGLTVLADLPQAFIHGHCNARQAVLTPLDGTMLDVFACLATEATPQVLADKDSAQGLLIALQESVLATAQILPEHRAAKVVDAGALAMFFFFEGFFAELYAWPTLLKSATYRFPELLHEATTYHGQTDNRASCVHAIVHTKTIPETESLHALGTSVVARHDGNTLNLHFHSDNPEQSREQLSRFGTLKSLQKEGLAPRVTAPNGPIHGPSTIHLLTDAAGSISRDQALEEDITLLDSYILFNDEARPETLWQATTLYQALRQGKKVTTAQASLRERGQHYESALEQYGKSLYLCVGSVYTGNYAAALAWKKEHDALNHLFIVDTGAASGRLACIVLLASRLNRQGLAKEELLVKIRELCVKSEEFVFIDDMKYLVASGRVSRAKGFAGKLLQLKPVISPLADGVCKRGVVHSHKGQLEFALTQARRFLQTAPLVLLQYSDNEDWVREHVLPELQVLLPTATILVTPLSLTSGVHMGPGTWALAICPQPEE